MEDYELRATSNPTEAPQFRDPAQKGARQALTMVCVQLGHARTQVPYLPTCHPNGSLRHALRRHAQRLSANDGQAYAMVIHMSSACPQPGHLSCRHSAPNCFLQRDDHERGSCVAQHHKVRDAEGCRVRLPTVAQRCTEPHNSQFT